MRYSCWILMVWGEEEYFKTPYAAVSVPNQTHAEMKSSPHPSVIFMTFHCRNICIHFPENKNTKKCFSLTIQSNHCRWILNTDWKMLLRPQTLGSNGSMIYRRRKWVRHQFFGIVCAPRLPRKLCGVTGNVLWRITVAVHGPLHGDCRINRN